MAHYHYAAKVFSRGKGDSAPLKAAYRAGECIECERTGQIADYRGRKDVHATEILVPPRAPDWAQDRARLWNEVERYERRKDAQVARELELALPCELTHEQKQSLVRTFVQDIFVSKGMIADVAYHDFEKKNPHAHVMLTLREVDESGFGKKNREWNSREFLKEQRELWAEYSNYSLEMAGSTESIDHRSYAARGINRVPGVHLGPEAAASEKRGIKTRLGEMNDFIEEVNEHLSHNQNIDGQQRSTEEQIAYLPGNRLDIRLIRNGREIWISSWTKEQAICCLDWLASKEREGYQVVVNPTGHPEAESRIVLVGLQEANGSKLSLALEQLRELAAEQGALSFDIAAVDRGYQSILGTFTIADFEESLELLGNYQRRGFDLYVRPLCDGISSNSPAGFVPLKLDVPRSPKELISERYQREMEWMRRRYRSRFDADRADWAICKKLAVEGFEKERVLEALLAESPEIEVRKGSSTEYYANRTVERAFTAVEQLAHLETEQQLYVH